MRPAPEETLWAEVLDRLGSLRTGLVVVAVVALAALGVALWALLDDTGDRRPARTQVACASSGWRIVSTVSRANSARRRRRAVWPRSAMVSRLSSSEYRRSRRRSSSLSAAAQDREEIAAAVEALQDSVEALEQRVEVVEQQQP